MLFWMTRVYLRADESLEQIIYKDLGIRANVNENPCSRFCPSQCQCQMYTDSEIYGFNFNEAVRSNMSLSTLNISMRLPH